jgi:hypothetical protein
MPVYLPESADEQNAEFWTISGRVRDAATGNPISNFRVTPGRERFQCPLELDERQSAQGTGGAYAVRVNKRFSVAVLKVEAPGHLPVLAVAPQEDRTDFDLALQPGMGPVGKVLTPDGTPAINVTVALVGFGGFAIRKGGMLDPCVENERLVTRTDAEGRFALPAELTMRWLIVSGAEGFVMVSMEEFAANSQLTLKRWGRVKGVLKRPSGPGSDENLDLHLAEPEPTPEWHIDIGNHIVADQEGRFDFERVPPGMMLNLVYQIKIDDRRCRTVPLRLPFMVGAGETLDLPIEAPERKTLEAFSIPQPPPCAKSGPPITGAVLLPSGEPASGAAVALVVPNAFLQLRRFVLGRGPDPSLRTTTDANGQFTLPGVPNAKAIVAVNTIGFAKIPLRPGGQPATLTLQPWGKISGTLRIGGRLGANERVALASGEFEHDMSFYYSPDFEARTDSKGCFVITFVPPGEQALGRVIMDGESWGTGHLTPVNVQPGGVTEVTIGGTGQKVVGKIVTPPPRAATDWSHVKVTLFTDQYGPPNSLKTNEERMAWYDSDEGQKISRKMRHYKTDIAFDGSFAFEEVEPEDYQLGVSRERVTKTDTGHCHLTMQMGWKKVSIPKISGEVSAAVCDLGTVEVSPPPEFPAATE